MSSPKVSALTREDIAATARNFRWARKMQKWSVIVEGRELPVRPLILEAAGVPPDDPTTSHQAVALLRGHGFEVRYLGKPAYGPEHSEPVQSELEDILRKLRGSLKGHHSLLDDREREHRIEKDRFGG